jgi:serine protease inhibitor
MQLGPVDEFSEVKVSAQYAIPGASCMLVFVPTPVACRLMHRSHVEFAVALHGQLPSEGDLAWSPYSVASALGLVAAGARGPTREELAAALAPGPEPPSEKLADLGQLLRASAALADAEAAVANTLWLRLGLNLREGYRREALVWPGGGVQLADFRTDPEGSRRTINADVEKTTRGLIRELLKPGSVTTDIGMVVVNALYLKVAWRLPFPQAATSLADFHTPTGTRQVPTMHQRGRLTYAQHAGWRMVTLPTAGDAVVDVLLPPSPAEAPSAETLATLHATGTPELVDLALPRFRVTGDLQVNGPLKALGVQRAFDRDRADFSGIMDDRLCISLVQHQAVLRVDEQGFEGAAATAVVMSTVSMEIAEPVPFHVDRPFLVLVRHKDTGAIYFLARVTDPGGGIGEPT